MADIDYQFKLMREQIDSLNRTVLQNHFLLTNLQQGLSFANPQRLDSCAGTAGINLDSIICRLKATSDVNRRIETLEAKLASLQCQIVDLDTKFSTMFNLVLNRLDKLEERPGDNKLPPNIAAAAATATAAATDLQDITKRIEQLEKKDCLSIAGRSRIGRSMVSLCSTPIVQRAITIAHYRYLSTSEGRSMSRLMFYDCMLDRSKHNEYGGGFNLSGDIVKHNRIHGIPFTLNSNVPDGDFSQVRNQPDNNDVHIVSGTFP